MSTGVENGGGPTPAPPGHVFPPLRPATPPRPVHRPTARETVIPRPAAPPEQHPSPHTPQPPRAPHPPAGPDPWLPPPPPDIPQPPPYPPFPAPRTAGRRTAAALCLVLGIGLLGGSVVGAWINHEPPAGQSADDSARVFRVTRDLWQGIPVDTLFPRTVSRAEAGPGGAARNWTRIGVAPASGCQDAFDPLLAKVLSPVGCLRLLRASYVDATFSRVTTVGILVTTADAPGMRTLSRRWTTERLGSRADLMPRTVPVPGTAAAAFADKQRGSWTVEVSDRLPIVVYAVSGFADGREIPVPQPAAEATANGATTAPAQAGLGNDAFALTAAVGDSLRRAAEEALNSPTGSS